MRAIDRLVLDTSAYSHLRKGHPEVLASLTAAVQASIPVIVLGELEAAFERGSRAAENQRVLAELLAEPFVNVLDVISTTVRHYARVFVSLRNAGTPIPLMGHLEDQDFAAVRRVAAGAEQTLRRIEQVATRAVAAIRRGAVPVVRDVVGRSHPIGATRAAEERLDKSCRRAVAVVEGIDRPRRPIVVPSAPKVSRNQTTCLQSCIPNAQLQDG